MSSLHPQQRRQQQQHPLHSHLYSSRRMNHCVPEFEMEDDYSIATTSGGLSRPRKSQLPGDDIMELLWQNGQVVMQSQTQRSSRKISSVTTKNDDAAAGVSTDMEISRASQPQEAQGGPSQHVFMQEDEMASWLHYPLVDDPSDLDNNFCSDLLYPTSCLNASTSAHPPPRAHKSHACFQFSGNKDSGRPSTSTVVDSSDTPAVAQHHSQILHFARRSSAEFSNANLRCGTTATAGYGGGEGLMTCDATVTSSPGASTSSAEPVMPAAQKPPLAGEDRKRKGREGEESTECCQSEGVDFESADTKKQERSTSTKRSRAAEVHNLSERRRRDRINEKMKALQELIPRCNKSDKASMLDEAIDYLKSLQLQVQMMSMGCGMVPMMYPGMQQYMPPMGMGIGMGLGMGMGMGMEMGMNRPLMPFPNVLAGSAMTAPGAAAHLGPRFHMPPFHMPHVPPAADLSRIHASNQSDQMLNTFATPNPNQSRVPNFSDPYQQYLGQHQMQLPQHQNQAMVHPCISKPGPTRGPENHQNR